MYVPKRTWVELGPKIPQQQNCSSSSSSQGNPAGGRVIAVPKFKVVPKKKGMGDDSVLSGFESIDDSSTIVAPSTTYNPAASTSVTPGTPTGASSLCFTGLFPFIGSSVGGVCTPIIPMSQTAQTLATAALVGLIAYKFLKGGRR